MSFRSRSTTIQPRTGRRSLSGSRVPTTSSSYSTSTRPLSSAYPSSYSNQYTNSYLSNRDGLYSSASSSPRNSYYNSGGSSSSGRRDSFSTIYKNPYSTDRYVSPYTSYDHGITTASLSIKPSLGSKNPYVSAYANKRNYLSASNMSLNSLPLSTSKSSSTIVNAATDVNRSQSFKDYDRKSRAVQRQSSLKSTASMRSMSVSSEKSEGYEVSSSCCISFSEMRHSEKTPKRKRNDEN